MEKMECIDDNDSHLLGCSKCPCRISLSNRLSYLSLDFAQYNIDNIIIFVVMMEEHEKHLQKVFEHLKNT